MKLNGTILSGGKGSIGVIFGEKGSSTMLGFEEGL